MFPDIISPFTFRFQNSYIIDQTVYDLSLTSVFVRYWAQMGYARSCQPFVDNVMACRWVDVLEMEHNVYNWVIM